MSAKSVFGSFLFEVACSLFLGRCLDDIALECCVKLLLAMGTAHLVASVQNLALDPQARYKSAAGKRLLLNSSCGESHSDVKAFLAAVLCCLGAEAHQRGGFHLTCMANDARTLPWTGA